MLLDADDLLEHLEQLARRRGVSGGFDRTVLDAALAEAGRLAGSSVQDEIAAIFFALSRRSRGFGKVSEPFVPAVARSQAIAVGYELLMDEMELQMLRAGVLRGELGFADLRSWFADCLRPLAT